MNLTPTLLCTLPVLIAGYLLYFPFRNRRMRIPKIMAKCTATLMCVVVACIGTLSIGQSPWLSLCFWGIVCCMLGDGLLEIHFLSGMAAFGLGHILLIGWIFTLFAMSGGVSSLVIVIWAIAWLAALLAFRNNLRQLGKKAIAFLLYAAVLMAMAAMAVMLPFRFDAAALSVAVGGALFAISDMFVAKGLFDYLSPFWDRFALAIYYIAVYCLALGPWFL